jgi:hypothetical protein
VIHSFIHHGTEPCLLSHLVTIVFPARTVKGEVQKRKSVRPIMHS